MKNLVLGYVQAPDRKKPEVLNLIAKILDFSPSEVNQVCIYNVRLPSVCVCLCVCVCIHRYMHVQCLLCMYTGWQIAMSYMCLCGGE